MRLFVAELKRALLPLAVISLAGTAIVLLIERVLILRGQLPTTVAGAVDLFLYLGIIVMGHVGGERAFSREFKEHDFPLLDTLPVPRWRIWLTVVGANALALWLCTAAVLAMRPSLAAGDESGILGALILQACLFAVACNFSLLFMRPVLAYPIGLLIAGLTFIEATGRGSVAMMMLEFEVGATTVVEFVLEQGQFVTPLLFVFFLGHSLYFFSRGEISLPRARLVNARTLVVTTIGVVVLARLLSIGSESAREYAMASGFYRYLDGVLVRPDGDQVAVLELSDPQSGPARIALIDARSGGRVSHLRGRSVRPVGWTDDGQEFLAVRLESRILASLDLFAPRSLSLVGMDTGGRIRPRLDLGRRESLNLRSIGGAGLYLMVSETAGDGSLIVVDVERAQMTEVAVGPSDGSPFLRDTPEGLLVRLDYGNAGSSAWLVGADPYAPRPVPVATDPGRSLPDLLLDGLLQTRTGKGASALLDRLGRPEADGRIEEEAGPGVYVLPTLVREDTPIFYVETRIADSSVRLFVKRPVDEDWTPVGQRIPAGPTYLEVVRTTPKGDMVESRSVRLLDSLAIHDFGEFAAFVFEENGIYRAGLHDARRGQSVELAELGPGGGESLPEVRLGRAGGVDGVLVGFWYDEVHTFRFDPSTGRTEKFQDLAFDASHQCRRYCWPSLRYRDASGAEIHRFADKLVRLTPDGRRVVLASE